MHVNLNIKIVHVNLLSPCPLQMPFPSTHNTEVNPKHSGTAAPDLTLLLLQIQLSWFNSSC
jgi:hypothetical protein